MHSYLKQWHIFQSAVTFKYEKNSVDIIQYWTSQVEIQGIWNWRGQFSSSPREYCKLLFCSLFFFFFLSTIFEEIVKGFTFAKMNKFGKHIFISSWKWTFPLPETRIYYSLVQARCWCNLIACKECMSGIVRIPHVIIWWQFEVRVF